MNRPCRILALVLILTSAQVWAAPPAGTAERHVQLMSEALYARDTGDLAGARQKLGELLALNPSDEAVKALLASLDAVPQKTVSVAGGTPAAAAVNVPATQDVPTLVARGRSQYLAGDSAAATRTFRAVEAREAGNAEAGYFLKRMESERTITGAQMLNEVDQAWRRPGVLTEQPLMAAGTSGPSPLFEKLNAIMLPSVNFSGMELSRVVNTLSVISQEFDHTGQEPKGVNIVLLDQANTNPLVNITLRNLTLKRVLDFITDSVGFQYEVQADAVVVRPGGEQSALATQFFPVSRSTVLRMTGKAATQNNGAAVPATNADGEGQAIRSFLQLAGVSFEGVPGSTLAFDGSQLIATQTPRNLERIRNILTRYNDVRQVEIEPSSWKCSRARSRNSACNGASPPRLPS